MKDDIEYLDIIKGCCKHSKHLLPYVTIESISKNLQLIDALIDVVLDNYCEIGLQNDYEPNALGIKLDDTISFLLQYRYSLED